MKPKRRWTGSKSIPIRLVRLPDDQDLVTLIAQCDEHDLRKLVDCLTDVVRLAQKKLGQDPLLSAMN